MNTMRHLPPAILLWVLFFLISCGLGYPTLNRYDARKQLPDAAVYAQLATSGASEVHDDFRFRVLVPFLVREVYRFAQGHVGTWNPLAFSFLVVNASFVASAAYLLCRVGDLLLGSRAVALLGAALYLLNFAIANLQLAGLVDSAEACLLMALIASMFYDRWFLLPMIAIFGTLAKDSFIPFSIAMTTGWWLASEDRRRRGHAAAIIAMAIVEVITLCFLLPLISGRAEGLWSLFQTFGSPTNYAMNFLHSLVDRNSWYILIWLVPLGLAGIKPFPRRWKTAALAGALAALILNAYHSTVGGSGGGIGRYIFNVAGPLLSLSAASLLSKLDFCEPR